MEIKTYRKMRIVSERFHSRRSGQERKQTYMIKLMNYNQWLSPK